jgi:hypothetical protein
VPASNLRRRDKRKAYVRARHSPDTQPSDWVSVWRNARSSICGAGGAICLLAETQNTDGEWRLERHLQTEILSCSEEPCNATMTVESATDSRTS